MNCHFDDGRNLTIQTKIHKISQSFMLHSFRNDNPLDSRFHGNDNFYMKNEVDLRILYLDRFIFNRLIKILKKKIIYTVN